MWILISIRPHQNHNSVLKPSQANEPLLAIRFAVVFSCEHWLIEGGVALRQINAMLSEVELLLGGSLLMCYLSYMRLSATVSPNKQLERAGMRHRTRAASAPFHSALASLTTRRRAAAELRRYTRA